MVTVIDVVVSPVLHVLPVAAEEVNVTEPPAQNVVGPFALMVITGVVFGAAMPVPAALVQPFTVCVTLYVFAVVTVIVEAVSFVFHNKVPAALVDSVEVPLQLFTTVTTGVAGVVFGAAMPVPAALVQPFTVCVTL